MSVPIDLGGMAWGGILSKVIFWVGWTLAGLAVVAVMGVFFYYMQFNIKADTWQMFGSGKDGVFSFSKKKTNRFKWVNKRTAWRPMKPFFNKKEIEPFDSEFIYPGNQVYAFVLNDVFIPARVNIGTDEDTIRAEINPVPHSVRNWQSLQHKKNAREFAEHNFWEDNKYFFMVIATAALCLVMVGLTVYFTYKFATGGSAAMSGLADALRNFNTIGGIGPN